MNSDSTVAFVAGGGGRRRRDRLSKLRDATLGHILSFLPADEAARAATLSRRWRHVFAHVHTVSLDEPEPEPDSDDDYGCYTPGFGRCRACVAKDRAAAFANRVSAALLGRLGGGAGVPLRALRVGLEGFYGGPNATLVDMWLRYAVRQAAAGDGLHLDLQLRRLDLPVCDRRYAVCREPPPAVATAKKTSPPAAAAAGANDEEDKDPSPYDYVAPRSIFMCAAVRTLRVGLEGFYGGPNATLVDMWLRYAVRQAAAGDGLHLDLQLRRLDLPVCDRRYAVCREPPPVATANKTSPPAAAAAAGANDEEDKDSSPYDYVAPRSIFMCAAVRTLRLGSCYLDLPPSSSGVALPSLDTLHLTAVTGRMGAVQRLVASCPCLAALTLEGCAKLTALSVPRAARLRTLALRCCHDLASVDVADASQLRAFEYRGAVPAGISFLTLHGGPIKVSKCTLDFCGEETMDPFHLDCLRGMFQLFVGVERLHLTSARIGCCASTLLPSVFPAFTKLRHLELTGIVPEDDTTAIDAVAKILERTPNLETLTLFFMPKPEPEPETESRHYGHAEELPHGHKLKYDERASLALLDVEPPSCFKERIKEINFVHYQGGMAQRMLAKFLLFNAPEVQEVCGGFASGPLFVQIKLMEEIKGWVMNKSANMMFF